MKKMYVREITQQDYYERINKVLLYISNHLDEKLDLEKLAAISNFSPFHFHRIMRAYLNDSLGNYIKRVRIETGAKLLKYSDESISDISIRIGYENASGFTKAFSKRFNCSPSDFRKNKAVISSNGVSVRQQDFSSFYVSEPKIVKEVEKKVAYTTTIKGYSDYSIGPLWEKLMSFVKKHKLFAWRSEAIGLTYDDPSITDIEKCRYEACVTVRKEFKPEGEIGFKVLSSGKYAKFKCKGTYGDLNEVYNEIYGYWIPKFGLIPTDDPSRDKYLNNPYNTKPEKLLTEIYIPIE